jgi:hypothetical protein
MNFSFSRNIKNVSPVKGISLKLPDSCNTIHLILQIHYFPIINDSEFFLISVLFTKISIPGALMFLYQNQYPLSNRKLLLSCTWIGIRFIKEYH